LINTAGGVENLALLNKPYSGVDLGFVNGGIATETDDTYLDSLGTICYEPIWFFSREPIPDRGLFAFKGKRVSVGPEGSDSKALVMEILKRNKLDLSYFKSLTLSTEDSADALLHGRIDGAVLVNSLASPVVRQLMKAPGIYIANFTRADAYVAHFPSLTKRVFPAGVSNLEFDKPPHDINLLATKTSLIANSKLHPALQYLILEMLAQVHSRSGVFQKAAEFPAGEAMEIQLSPEARHYYKSGRPLLQRYLPFWFAVLVEQLVVLLIPILGLTYPLIKGLMAFYGWGMQRKIFLIYGELHWLESQIEKLGRQKPPQELLERMEHLEAKANRIKVSAKYMPMLYSLKDTLASVRKRLL
jgi:TRAP-type uncharacterized transport system substrate-binding protein